MYLKKTPNTHGRIRLSIVDNYYDKVKKCSRQKTVESIGWLDELEKQYDEASLWNGLTSKEAGPFQTEVRKVLVEVFGLYETKQGENKPGAEKKKLVVRSPFVWKNKGEF